MKPIALIDASPRIGEATASSRYLGLFETFLKEKNLSPQRFEVRRLLGAGEGSNEMERLFAMDAVVFAFPLYNFCLPGVLIRLLENMAQSLRQSGRTLQGVKVLGIVNCGFPEPEINAEAVKALELFCRRTGADFRGGILIGSGPVLFRLLRLRPFARAKNELFGAYAAAAADFAGEADLQPASRCVRLNLSRRLYYRMANAGWVSGIRKNGLNKKALYRRPYAQGEPIKGGERL